MPPAPTTRPPLTVGAKATPCANPTQTLSHPKVHRASDLRTRGGCRSRGRSLRRHRSRLGRPRRRSQGEEAINLRPYRLRIGHTRRAHWFSRFAPYAPSPPTPPAEQATACQDQAGQASTGDGTGHCNSRESVNDAITECDAKTGIVGGDHRINIGGKNVRIWDALRKEVRRVQTRRHINCIRHICVDRNHVVSELSSRSFGWG